MKEINYFHPYSSASINHENQLTWAFLALLKYSPSFFRSFYFDLYVKAGIKELPNAHELLDIDVNFETQIGKANFSTSYILSVLITNDQLTSSPNLTGSERSPVYDGIITIGEHLSVIIENKPNKDHVWPDQLNPSIEHFNSEDTILIEKPITLEWKEIISALHLFAKDTTQSYTEKLLADDFLSYINRVRPELNPFDSFDLCQRNPYLLNKRIENVLKEIVNDEARVKYHHGWGYYIEVPYSSIRKIGLILHKDGIELSFFFADTQSQSKSYYPKNIDVNLFKENKWFVYPNFHLAYRSSNIVWFQSDSPEKYIEYWNKHGKSLKQVQSQNKLREYISQLHSEGVINSVKQTEMQSKIYQSKMTKFNICAGLGFIYRHQFNALEELDRKGLFVEDLKDKIKFCLENALLKTDQNFLV